MTKSPAIQKQIEDFIQIEKVDIENNIENDIEIFGVENFAETLSIENKEPGIYKKLVKEQEKELARYKRKVKRYVKPSNAKFIKDYIPETNQSSFLLMNGNCEFVDFINEFIKEVGEIKEIYLTTLGLNLYTFKVLNKTLGNIKKNILVSTFFYSTDKHKVLKKMFNKNQLKGYKIGIFRNHTKMVLLKTKSDFYLFSGSANLKSSGNIEQFTIYNSKKLYNFNKDWISRVIKTNLYNPDRKDYNQLKPYLA